MDQEDTFKDLLAAIRPYPKAMDADTLHGFLTGMAINLDEIFDAPWLATLLGLPDDSPINTELERIGELAEGCADILADDLLVEEFQPRVGSETCAGHVLPRTDLWCQGFVTSIGLAEQQWRAWTEQDTELAQQILSINMIADPPRYGPLLFDAAVNSTAAEFLAEIRALAGPLAQAIFEHVVTLQDGADLAWEEDDEEGAACGLDELLELPTFDAQELRGYTEPELMGLITTLCDRVPRALVDEAARRGAKLLPLLAAHLADDRNWGESANIGDWWALLHSIMILGAMDEPRAAPLLAGLFERLCSDPDNDLWDWLAGYWPALFSNKRGYATAHLRAIAADRGLNWPGRIHALECVLEAAAVAGSDALDHALDWAAAFAADSAEEEYMRMTTGQVLLSLPRERHRALLEELVRVQIEQKHWIMHFDSSEIERALQRGDDPEWSRFDNPWQFYAHEQILERQRRWSAEDDLDVADDHDFPAGSNSTMDLPYVRATDKIGRNDPCSCGSGKKYKKCCLP